MIRPTLILFLIVLITFSSNAANRYWISGSSANWNNTINWSTSSGGSGGASIPGSSDYVYFDANGTGVCTLVADITVATMKMTAGTLNTSTYNFLVSGPYSCIFSGGTINGNNTFNISLTGTAARVTFSGTTFNPDIHVVSPQIMLSGSTFNGTSYFEKNGAGSNTGAGGNTFVGNCTIKNTGSAYFNLGNNGDDTFSADLTVDNSSTSNVFIAYNNSTTTIAGNLIVNSNGNCGSTSISHTASSVNITGNCTVNINTSSTSKMYLGYDNAINIGGNLNITNGGIDNSTVYLALKSTASATIGGITTIVNNGTGSLSRIYLGVEGDVTFNNTLKITNSSSATDSYLYCNYKTNSINNYNGNIELNNSSIKEINFGRSGGQGVLANGKTISIGASGFTAGTLYLRNFTQSGTTSQNITTTGTSIFTQIKNEWNGNVVFKAPKILTTETSYKGTATLEKTGGIDNTLGDKNIYKENATIINSSGSYLSISRDDPDTYEKNLTITNSGTDEIYLGYLAAGINVKGNLTVANTDNATNISIAYNEGSSITVDGTTAITNSSSAIASRIYFGNIGDVTAKGDCYFNNEATGNKGNIYIANNENSDINITGDVIITNKNAGADKRVFFGNHGDIILNGDLSIKNTATATDSYVSCSNSLNSVSEYNGDITLASNGAGCKGILFGNSGGSSTLSDGKTIKVDADGFSEGTLKIKNFTQTGTTAQTLNLSDNGKLNIDISTWGGNISFKAPSVYLKSSTYNGTATIEKTGSTLDTSFGGNTYNITSLIKNSGSGNLKLANDAGNDYNDDVTFVISSPSGHLRPASKFNSTHSGDLYIDTYEAFYIGESDGGFFEFDGNTAQSINKIGTANIVNFRKLRINNSSNEITLNIPIRIGNNLDLINGNIITTDINILRMNSTTVVDHVSDNSYIDGPIIKYGADAFVFPIGGTDTFGNSHYAGIGISAPSDPTHSFTAQYFATEPGSATTYSAPLTKVSLVESWELDRTDGASTVDVSLYWNNGTRSGIGNTTDLRVAHWNGSTWEDKGNDATSGGPGSGSITVNGISSFSPFTFGTIDNENNPLPISLINFRAIKNNKSVKLEWSTASEENNDIFIIERTDNLKNITEIGTVGGAGNSNTILNYETFDYSPLEGKSYYRLVQVDFDGKKEYFDWNMVDFSNNSSKNIVIYPNPTDNGITNVNMEGFEGHATIELMDVNAKIIYRKNIQINNSSFSFPIDLNLSSGIYFIRVMDNNSIDIKKWIIK
ncbi:MAG: T9SS type A sorting domain-containing protein [Bacteroidales bacterium]|nr:T9SS type A sorting domain-containing protein [Bacteroidales bacterium]